MNGQTGSILGQILEPNDEPAPFANVALYTTESKDLVKVEISDEEGNFELRKIGPGSYTLEITYVGFEDIQQNIEIGDQVVNLGPLKFAEVTVELAEAVITGRRAMVEVKPDRTVFNVEGTINSVGSDAISLLRKAPGVTVDNNNNINVLGRAGVLLYVDGRRLPLSGEDLTNYLQDLPAEQIDRIDIISNPGAKYEAEGNAGIIDIRLKKADNIGANGSVSSTFTRGRHSRGNASLNGNYRNSKMNVFGTFGWARGRNYTDMDFNSTQNDLRLVESNRLIRDWDNYNLRGGIDYFLAKDHTIGVLVGVRTSDRDGSGLNRITIAPQSTGIIDSILVANNSSISESNQNTYNINYRFDPGKGTSLNIDLDYGSYRNISNRLQPNQYFDAGEQAVLTEIINSFETPSDIDISSVRIDYETKGLGGNIGFGTKFTKVVSDNTFLFNNIIDGVETRNDQNSNIFKYDENVYAGYVNYNRKLGEKLNLSLGLRAEQTDARGDLRAFVDNLNEPPVLLNYLSWFPNAGLTWQVTSDDILSMNYGRRINRPDYNVLNPFNFQLSEISFEKGNPFLNPEIVNNVELGYTLNYRYNFKLSYSVTTDQITRLIAPDEFDPRANFITWENLATQKVWGFNLSAPVTVSDKWNVYTNLSASHLDNQADYGDGAVVDVQAFTYSIFQQHTITLPGGFTGEVSGYFAGPGVWGGVFEYETSYSLNLGLQKKFLNDQLNIRLSANDIFYQTGWDGISEFNGLISRGSGNWDSRNVSLSASYRFGNQKVKSRNRKTGIEAEAGRVTES